MTLQCPECGTQIDVDDRARSGGTVRCDACSREVELDRTEAQFSDNSPAPTPGARRPDDAADVALPSGVQRRDDADGLYLVRHWNRLYGALYAACAGAVFYALLFNDASFLKAGWLGVVGVVLFFSLFYFALGQLLNDTHIHVRSTDSGPPEVEIRHAPLPWPGGQTLPADQIRQLFVTKDVYRSRHGTRTRFDLEAKTLDGRHVTLLDDLKTPTDAEAIERAVESHLDIEDRTVEGEYNNASTKWL